jgi:hypothetical protein
MGYSFWKPLADWRSVGYCALCLAYCRSNTSVFKDPTLEYTLFYARPICVLVNKNRWEGSAAKASQTPNPFPKSQMTTLWDSVV